METKKKKAVIYARVSSVSDRQDTTRQIEDLKRYAVLQDIEIVRIFQEHISGAKKIEERQVLAECLEYCTKESVNYLLLSELSRLGRSTLQVLRSLEILHEAKVSVYIQNLGLYTLQPNGEVNPIASIMVTVLAEMANIERTNIQYRLNSGRANYIAKGGDSFTKERLFGEEHCQIAGYRCFDCSKGEKPICKINDCQYKRFSYICAVPAME